jgi:hypothetical protein
MAWSRPLPPFAHRPACRGPLESAVLDPHRGTLSSGGRRRGPAALGGCRCGGRRRLRRLPVPVGGSADTAGHGTGAAMDGFRPVAVRCRRVIGGKESLTPLLNERQGPRRLGGGYLTFRVIPAEVCTAKWGAERLDRVQAGVLGERRAAGCTAWAITEVACASHRPFAARTRLTRTGVYGDVGCGRQRHPTEMPRR